MTDLQEHRRAAPLTALFVVANVLVFGYQIALALQGGAVLETWLQRWALVPARLVAQWQESEAWLRIGSAMFLHAGWAHLAGNVWFLWVFGRTLEGRLGSVRFLFLYLFAGTVAAWSQVALDPRSTIPMIGASGAISGVLGAYLRLFPTGWVWTLVPWIVPILPVPAAVFLLVWFLFQLANGLGAFVPVDGYAADGVAWWAHAGGFVGGWVFAHLAGRPRAGAKRREPRRSRRR